MKNIKIKNLPRIICLSCSTYDKPENGGTILSSSEFDIREGSEYYKKIEDFIINIYNQDIRKEKLENLQKNNPK